VAGLLAAAIVVIGAMRRCDSASVRAAAGSTGLAAG
jgi:hypothetical protein